MIKPLAEQICGSRISTPGKSMAAAVAKLLCAGAPTAGVQAAPQSFFSPFSPQKRPRPLPKGADLPQEILLRWIRTVGSCIFVIRLKFLQ